MKKAKQTEFPFMMDASTKPLKRYKTHCKWGHDIAIVGRKNNGKGTCWQCERDYQKRWNKNNPLLRQARNWKQYGIRLTVDEYKNKLITSGYRCNICDAEVSSLKTALAVDHNHYTGQVRGLLCGQCNILLGLVKEDVILLNKFVQYLNHWRNYETVHV